MVFDETMGPNSANHVIETWSAFCSHQGAHATGTRPWTDWNAELLRPMVADLEDTEEMFRIDFEQATQRFNETTGNELTTLNRSITGTSNINIWYN